MFCYCLYLLIASTGFPSHVLSDKQHLRPHPSFFIPRYPRHTKISLTSTRFPGQRIKREKHDKKSGTRYSAPSLATDGVHAIIGDEPSNKGTGRYKREHILRRASSHVETPTYSFIKRSNGGIYTPTLFSRQCLCTHNKLRKTHGVPPLEWSTGLAEGAQHRANELALNKHIPQRRTNGENLYMSGKIIDLSTTCLVAVNAWYRKGDLFDYEKPGPISTEPFTQIIWKSTSHIGVARAISPSGKLVVVARYAPPGNLAQAFKDNVHKPVKQLNSTLVSTCAQNFVNSLSFSDKRKSSKERHSEVSTRKNVVQRKNDRKSTTNTSRDRQKLNLKAPKHLPGFTLKTLGRKIEETTGVSIDQLHSSKARSTKTRLQETGRKISSPAYNHAQSTTIKTDDVGSSQVEHIGNTKLVKTSQGHQHSARKRSHSANSAPTTMTTEFSEPVAAPRTVNPKSHKTSKHLNPKPHLPSLTSLSETTKPKPLIPKSLAEPLRIKHQNNNIHNSLFHHKTYPSSSNKQNRPNTTHILDTAPTDVRPGPLVPDNLAKPLLIKTSPNRIKDSSSSTHSTHPPSSNKQNRPNTTHILDTSPTDVRPGPLVPDSLAKPLLTKASPNSIKDTSSPNSIHLSPSSKLNTAKPLDTPLTDVQPGPLVPDSLAKPLLTKASSNSINDTSSPNSIHLSPSSKLNTAKLLDTPLTDVHPGPLVPDNLAKPLLTKTSPSKTQNSSSSLHLTYFSSSKPKTPQIIDTPLTDVHHGPLVPESLAKALLIKTSQHNIKDASSSPQHSIHLSSGNTPQTDSSKTLLVPASIVKPLITKTSPNDINDNIPSKPHLTHKNATRPSPYGQDKNADLVIFTSTASTNTSSLSTNTSHPSTTHRNATSQVNPSKPHLSNKNATRPSPYGQDKNADLVILTSTESTNMSSLSTNTSHPSTTHKNNTTPYINPSKPHLSHNNVTRPSPYGQDDNADLVIFTSTSTNASFDPSTINRNISSPKQTNSLASDSLNTSPPGSSTPPFTFTHPSRAPNNPDIPSGPTDTHGIPKHPHKISKPPGIPNSSPDIPGPPGSFDSTGSLGSTSSPDIQGKPPKVHKLTVGTPGGPTRPIGSPDVPGPPGSFDSIGSPGSTTSPDFHGKPSKTTKSTGSPGGPTRPIGSLDVPGPPGSFGSTSSPSTTSSPDIPGPTSSPDVPKLRSKHDPTIFPSSIDIPGQPGSPQPASSPNSTTSPAVPKPPGKPESTSSAGPTSSPDIPGPPGSPELTTSPSFPDVPSSTTTTSPDIPGPPGSPQSTSSTTTTSPDIPGPPGSPQSTTSTTTTSPDIPGPPGSPQSTSSTTTTSPDIPGPPGSPQPTSSTTTTSPDIPGPPGSPQPTSSTTTTSPDIPGPPGSPQSTSSTTTTSPDIPKPPGSPEPTISPGQPILKPPSPTTFPPQKPLPPIEKPTPLPHILPAKKKPIQPLPHPPTIPPLTHTIPKQHLLHLPPQPTSPTIVGKRFNITIVLRDQMFNEDLTKPISLTYFQLKRAIEQAMRNLYSDNSYFTNVKLIGFGAVPMDKNPAISSLLSPKTSFTSAKRMLLNQDVLAGVKLLVNFNKVMKSHLVLLSSQLDSGVLGSVPVMPVLFAVRLDDDPICPTTCHRQNYCYPACTSVCCASTTQTT